MSNGWGSTTGGQDGGAAYSNNPSSYNGFNDGYNAQGNTYGSGHAGQSGSYGSSSPNTNSSMNQGNGSGWQSSSASNQSNPRHWQEPSASERQEPRFELDDGPICQNYLAGRCNLGASCRYRHQLPNTDFIPQAREVDPNNYQQRSSSVVSASNATPIGGQRSFGTDQQQTGSSSIPGDRYQQDGQQQGSSSGWNMQRREPAGWGNPPPSTRAQRPQEQTNDGWPAPRNISSGYVAPVGSQGGRSSNTGYSSPAQQQSTSYSGRPIADNAPPDGGRGWVGEGRQSSRFSAPVEDRYSAASEKLKPSSQDTSAFSSGWQTISSDEHEARSAVSRKSSRFEAKPLPAQSEPVPPLPDLPVSRPAQTLQQQTSASPVEPRSAAAPSSAQGYPQQQQQSQGFSSGTQLQSNQNQSNHLSAPQVSSSDWVSTGPAHASSAGPLERPSSQAISYSHNEPAQSDAPSVAERDETQKQPAAVPAEPTVRHGLPGSSRPEPDEVWVLKDYNAMRNNMWSPTLRSPRINREEGTSEPSVNRSILVSLDDYKESSESRAAADGVAGQGAREAAPIVPAHHEHRQGNLDQSTMSVAGESIRPSESASNVGGSVASDDDNRTMRSPSRSMHGPSSRSGKFRTFSSQNSNAGDGTGSSSPISNFDDNPNATTTGWDPIPAKPLANPPIGAQPHPVQTAQQSSQADITRELPPHQHQQQPESRREPAQQYSNGWQPTNSGNQHGWNSTPSQPPLPAPTPRQSSSASYAAVNDLERAATPRAARSTVSTNSRVSNVHPHQQQSVPSERAATPSISIKGASKYHAESNDLKEQLAQALAKIVNYERRLTLSLQELESEKVEMMAVENRRLRQRIAVLEGEREAVKAALMPALTILSGSGGSKKPKSVVGNAAAPMQNGGKATPVRVKQETPPAVNGWS